MIKYFKLSQDKRLSNAVLLSVPDKIRGYFEAKAGNTQNLDDALLSPIKESKHNFYPDILDMQIFMIKDAVKEVFDLFLPGHEYKHCCFIEGTSDKYTLYYIPTLEIMSVEKAREQSAHIFRIADTKEAEIAVSLEAVEAVLRRNPVGVRVEAISD